MTDSMVREYNLYTDSSVLRLRNELGKVTAAKPGPYSFTDFSGFDCLCFCGNGRLLEFAGTIGLSESSKVLDMCSGLGSASRAIAAQFPSEVIALDFVDGFTLLNRDISELSGLTNVKPFTGDATAFDLDEFSLRSSCKLAYSLQSFYHIQDKAALFTKAFEALEEGGFFYIEDFIMANESPLNEEEVKRLNEFCLDSRIGKEEYSKSLEEAGFRIVKFDLEGKLFSEFCYKRANVWAAKRDTIRTEYPEFYQIRDPAVLDLATYFFRDVGSAEEAKSAYSVLVEALGEEEFLRRTQLPLTVTGAFIVAQK